MAKKKQPKRIETHLESINRIIGGGTSKKEQKQPHNAPRTYVPDTRKKKRGTN